MISETKVKYLFLCSNIFLVICVIATIAGMISNRPNIMDQKNNPEVLSQQKSIKSLLDTNNKLVKKSYDSEKQIWEKYLVLNNMTKDEFIQNYNNKSNLMF